MARPTKMPEDRKRCYSVTLTPAQKEVFEKIGGSPWLQEQIDDVADVVQKLTPEDLVAVKKSAKQARKAFFDGWQYNPETRGWSTK